MQTGTMEKDNTVYMTNEHNKNLQELLLPWSYLNNDLKLSLMNP